MVLIYHKIVIILAFCKDFFNHNIIMTQKYVSP